MTLGTIAKKNQIEDNATQHGSNRVKTILGEDSHSMTGFALEQYLLFDLLSVSPNGKHLRVC